MTRWRTGRTLGRTLYRDDVCVGMVDTPELAKSIVDAMNREPLIANDAASQAYVDSLVPEQTWRTRRRPIR